MSNPNFDWTPAGVTLKNLSPNEATLLIKGLEKLQEDFMLPTSTLTRIRYLLTDLKDTYPHSDRAYGMILADDAAFDKGLDNV